MNPENQNPNPIVPQPIQPPPSEPVPEILPTGINTEQNLTPQTPESTPPTMHEIPKPKSKFTIFVIILLILTSLASLGYWAYKSYFANNTVVPAETPTPMATVDPTANWKTYTSSNNYQVRYPNSWRIVESNQLVGFGPQEIPEDILWAINIFDGADNSKESILADIGKQFSDKKQTTKNLEINGISALEIITKTPSIPTWYSDTILIEYGTSYITISNGAVMDSELQKTKGVPSGITFSDFYNTFRFMN